MKIAILGTSRGRTTVLYYKILNQYPALTSMYEFFNMNLKTKSFIEISKMLSTMDNYIIKILTHDLFHNDSKIEYLNLENYNLIYMIERPDFYHQCCSLEFSGNHNIWHQTSQGKNRYDIINKIPIKLQLDTILFQAKGVHKQIEIKKYLIKNQIKFEINDYNDPTFNKTNQVIDPKLNYENIITNYNSKDLVESLFNKHFNYNTLKNDLDSFNEELLLNFVVP